MLEQIRPLGLALVCPREEDLYDAGQHARQAGGGDSRSPWNRNGMRFDIDAAASSSSSSSSSAKIGGSVTVWAEWTAQEQQDFQAALAPFEADTGITVNYQGKGNNMDTALTAAVAGGSPPDVALVPDPGTLDTLCQAERDQAADEHARQPDVQLRRRVEHAGELQRHAVRRVVQGREQEHDLVQPGALHRRQASRRRRPRGSSCSPTPRS